MDCMSQLQQAVMGNLGSSTHILHCNPLTTVILTFRGLILIAFLS